MGTDFLEMLVSELKEHHTNFFKFNKKISYNDFTFNVQYITKLRENLNNIDKYCSWSNMSYKNCENAVKAFGHNSEEYIGLIDTSLFKSGKTGIMFTNKGICIRSHLQSAQYITYNELCLAIIKSSNVNSYECEIDEDFFNNYIRTFTAGKVVYKTIYYIKQHLFRVNKEWIYNTAKVLLNEALENINCKFAGLAIDMSEHLYNAFAGFDKYLKNVSSEVSSLALIAVGNFDEAKSIIDENNIQWLADNLDRYKNEYNDYKYNTYLDKADNQFDLKKYTDAINNYQIALKYKKDRKAYVGILESYYQDASEDNLFNVKEYREWIQHFKSFVGEDLHNKENRKYYNHETNLNKKRTNYLDKLRRDLPYIVLSNDRQKLIDNPQLLTVNDNLGMNIFMYSILFDNLSLLDLYSKEQLNDMKVCENILGHDYLCVAAMHSASMFVTMLHRYDEQYKSEKNWTKVKKTVNTVGYICNVMLSSATKSEMSKDIYRDCYHDEDIRNEYEYLKMQSKISDEKTESFQNRKSELDDEMLEYVQTRYEETVDKIKKTFLEIYANKQELTSELENIRQKMDNIHLGITKIEYDKALLDDTAENLLREYKEKIMYPINNLKKDEFETIEEFKIRKQSKEIKAEQAIQEYQHGQLEEDLKKMLPPIDSEKQKKIGEFLKQIEDIETKMRIPYLLNSYAYTSKVSNIEFESYDSENEKYKFITEHFEGDFKMNIYTAKKIRKSPEKYKVEDNISICMNEDNSVNVIHKISLAVFNSIYNSTVEHPLKYTVGFEKGNRYAKNV